MFRWLETLENLTLSSYWILSTVIAETLTFTLPSKWTIFDNEEWYCHSPSPDCVYNNLDFSESDFMQVITLAYNNVKSLVGGKCQDSLPSLHTRTWHLLCRRAHMSNELAFGREPGCVFTLHLEAPKPLTIKKSISNFHGMAFGWVSSGPRSIRYSFDSLEQCSLLAGRIRYLLIARLLRLTRLLVLMERYKVMVSTFLKLIPSLMPYLGITFLLMCFFCTLGVQVHICSSSYMLLNCPGLLLTLSTVGSWFRFAIHMFVNCNGVSGIFCRFLGELLMMEIQGFQTVLYMRMSIHLVTVAFAFFFYDDVYGWFGHC